MLSTYVAAGIALRVPGRDDVHAVLDIGRIRRIGAEAEIVVA